ncbi:MAG: hypothetical protein HYR60_10805, partial [Acidobacteria bacterium]|nr:hypothetical protein [Acidobacteriota bacterium]
MRGLSLPQRLRDPYFYLADFDFEEEMMVFALSRRTEFPRSLRLSASDFPLDNLRCVPFERVYREMDWGPQVPSLNYLLHLPFCGSTLLTRYLEHATLMLRDPVSLNALYFKDEERTKFPASILKLRRATFRLLNRRVEDRATIIRTAGYHPELIPHLVGSPAFRSSVFLYASP